MQNHAKKLGFLLALFVSGCYTDPSSNGLTEGTAVLNTPYKSVTFTKNGVTGRTMNLTYGYGSAAFHDPKEPDTDVWTIGDRGANFGCTDVDKNGQLYTGISGFCTTAAGAVDDNGVVFPTPDYVATLNHIRVATDEKGVLAATVLAQIPIHDGNGKPISGISNPYAENPYNAQGEPIPFDSDGLDVEALARLPDGSFWMGEEYASSLVHVAADGTVLERVVPVGVKALLPGVTYPVTEGLPAVVFKRKLNRGIENMTISPDGKTLYFALQSPLANPDASAYKQSRNVRLFTASIKPDGSFDKATGEYVFVLDTPDTFADAAGHGDPGKKQNDVKLSELTALPDGRLIIDERITRTTKLERIDFSKSTNILGSKWDDISTSPSLELAKLDTPSDQASAGIVPTVQTIVFNSLTDAPDLASKIEGVAILNSKYVLLTNDNDFGIDGDPSTFTVLPITAQLMK